jgi:hypothetical protein
LFEAGVRSFLGEWVEERLSFRGREVGVLLFLAYKSIEIRWGSRYNEINGKRRYADFGRLMGWKQDHNQDLHSWSSSQWRSQQININACVIETIAE